MVRKKINLRKVIKWSPCIVDKGSFYFPAVVKKYHIVLEGFSHMWDKGEDGGGKRRRYPRPLSSPGRIFFGNTLFIVSLLSYLDMFSSTQYKGEFTLLGTK